MNKAATTLYTIYNQFREKSTPLLIVLTVATWLLTTIADQYKEKLLDDYNLGDNTLQATGLTLSTLTSLLFILIASIREPVETFAVVGQIQEMADALEEEMEIEVLSNKLGLKVTSIAKPTLPFSAKNVFQITTACYGMLVLGLAVYFESHDIDFTISMSVSLFQTATEGSLAFYSYHQRKNVESLLSALKLQLTEQIDSLRQAVETKSRKVDALLFKNNPQAPLSLNKDESEQVSKLSAERSQLHELANRYEAIQKGARYQDRDLENAPHTESSANDATLDFSTPAPTEGQNSSFPALFGRIRRWVSALGLVPSPPSSRVSPVSDDGHSLADLAFSSAAYADAAEFHDIATDEMPPKEVPTIQATNTGTKSLIYTLPGAIAPSPVLAAFSGGDDALDQLTIM